MTQECHYVLLVLLAVCERLQKPFGDPLDLVLHRTQAALHSKQVVSVGAVP